MAWLERRTGALLVLSAVMPSEFNLLINPEHSDAQRIRIVTVQRYPFDRRLLKPIDGQILFRTWSGAAVPLFQNFSKTNWKRKVAESSQNLH